MSTNTGQAMKEAGMKLAVTNKRETLERARITAMVFALKNGKVTADDLGSTLRIALGPATGSVFKTADFEFTGYRITSKRPSNHARELKVWRLTTTGTEKVEKWLRKEKQPTQAEDRINRTPPIKTPLPSWLR